MNRFLGLLLAAQAHALKKVLVTGAGGRTGKLVFEQLKADDNYKPVGLARSSKAQKALSAVGATTDEVVVADIADEKSLAAAMAGCDAVVLCTSAVPAIKPLSLMKTMATKFLPFVKTSRPAFKFPKNGTPEEVDWLGAKKQIDAAKAAGIKQFVFVSSMGGTNPDNFLNSIGRRKDGSGGDILLWKRKAERYLVDSGVPYTIIHPGGLVDEDGSKRELVVGVNDEIMKNPEFASGGTRSVCRADVARVCKAALGSASATNVALDLVSKKAGDGTPTKDASSVFTSPGKYTYESAATDPPSIFS